MIEVEVHSSLRAFLRVTPERTWPHHLTMGRLVARALRLGRNALIQTGGGTDGQYRLSYLMPVLMWDEPTVLVVPESIGQHLLRVEIPQLKEWSDSRKVVKSGDRLPLDFDGLLLVAPQTWLADKLSGGDRFPDGIPTLFDGIDDLETWTRQELTVEIAELHWQELYAAYPDRLEVIREARVQLTKAVFQHPVNPDNCYLLDPPDLQVLSDLAREMSLQPPDRLPPAWQAFWQRFQTENSLTWVELDRARGQFSIYTSPTDVAQLLQPIWQQQPIVLMGGAIDLDPKAAIYRQRTGLDDLTCVKFALDRQNAFIHLYLPDGLPLPNTPQFQTALIRELHTLIRVSSAGTNLDRQGCARRSNAIVILIGDTPLKAIVGSVLAAEFGSRVRVEQTELADNGILVAGWEFWRKHQAELPTPKLLTIATLPLPSLENPIVAGQVAYYKRQRQDWFVMYLLPNALSTLQQAIAPIRNGQSVVALLDVRVLYRSYGSQFLSALEPMARINYLDASLFTA